MLLILIIKLVATKDPTEGSGSAISITDQDQTSITCSIDEIVVNVGSYSNGRLSPISLGTCQRLSPQFESNNTIRVQKKSGLWIYDCGFKRWENETNVIFQTDLTFIENRQANSFGIWTPKYLADSQYLQVFTQNIQCSYDKMVDSRKFVRKQPVQIKPACEKCEGCFFNETNNYTYTCDG